MCQVVALEKFRGKIVALRLNKEWLKTLESKSSNGFVIAEDVFDWHATLSDVIADFNNRRGLGVRYADGLSEILWGPIEDEINSGMLADWVSGEKWLEIPSGKDSS